MEKICKAHGQVICLCGTQLVRCKCSGPVPIGKIECIHWQTTRELMEELIDHAAAWSAESPTRMVFACQRIAKAERKKIDDVFLEIKTQVKARTGSDRLPGEALDSSQWN